MPLLKSYDGADANDDDDDDNNNNDETDVKNA